MKLWSYLLKKQRKFWILGVEQNSFDGVILSNVLDVMPKDISTIVIDDLERVPEDSQQEAGYWKRLSGFFYEVRQTAHFADGYKFLGERFISHGNIPGSIPENPSHAAADTGFSDRRRW